MSHIIQLKKGTVRYFYRVVSSNGNVLSVSQKYFSKSNAKRAAKRIANSLKAKYTEA